MLLVRMLISYLRLTLLKCVIDATGVPDVGAKVATDAMRNKKHVVMLNVETDVVIGPYLKKLAEEEALSTQDLMEMSRVQLCICIASLKQWA